MASEALVTVQNTECLHELEVEIDSQAASSATWLYRATSTTTCTMLWWQHGGVLDFFAAPCYESGRDQDAASGLPCNSLPLVGQVRLDLCGSDAMATSQAQQAPQAALLECLGPITAATMAPTPSSPVEDCVNEVLTNPVVVSVVDCVNDLQNPPPDDGPMSLESTTCPVGVSLCPSPILDLDALTVCGIGVPVPEVGFCDSPETGITVNRYPVCVTVTICPSPQTGIKVNGIGYCQPSLDIRTCDLPEVGIEPTCVTPPSLCPAPSIGVPPTCFDAVGLVYLVVGIVLDLIGDQDCRAGTMSYQDADGDTWCASPEEIRQDSIPETYYPSQEDEDASSTIEDNTAVVELEELDPDFYYPAVAPASAMSATSTPTCSQYRTTCNVVFIRGYDPDPFNGYGDFATAKSYYENHGYTVRELDTYGKCAGVYTDVAAAAGNHQTAFYKHHDAGTTCSPNGSHDQDTDIRHMAYHVAWWIHDNYGTQPVDVIGHSMGGLLIRYAITMSGRDPTSGWPPDKLNVEDVITVGTPHKGVPAGSWGWTRQLEQMDPDSSFMTFLRTEAQNPQGLISTDWTLIGADEDGKVSEDNARGMTAPHKIRYNQNCCGGWVDGGYDHDEYFLDDNEAETTTYYWKNAEGATVYDQHAPHSVKRMYWGTVAATH